MTFQDSAADGENRDAEPIRPHGDSPASASMLQAWSELTFLHWRYPADAMQAMLPRELRVDTFDGAAWVGLVPFRITGLTPPRVPPLPWLSHFLETNVRTYVVGPGGRRGVWFFSLDAARLPAVIGARVSFALPYYWARMKLEREGPRFRYASQRRISAAGCEISVEAGEPIPTPSELELFLTARFWLYAQRRGRLLDAQVGHAPWPLQRAQVISWRESLLEAAGLAKPMGEPRALYAERVDVVVGKVERTSLH